MTTYLIHKIPTIKVIAYLKLNYECKPIKKLAPTYNIALTLNSLIVAKRTRNNCKI